MRRHCIAASVADTPAPAPAPAESPAATATVELSPIPAPATPVDIVAAESAAVAVAVKATAAGLDWTLLPPRGAEGPELEMGSEAGPGAGGAEGTLPAARPPPRGVGGPIARTK